MSVAASVDVMVVVEEGSNVTTCNVGIVLIFTCKIMWMFICRVLFGRVVDECYCQLVIQTHRLTSIQSVHIFDGECDRKYA